MTITTLAPATPLDCLSCREQARHLSPAAASTIPDTDLCSHCLAVKLRGDLDELASLLREIREGIDAGRDALPDDLIDKADQVLKEACSHGL